LNTAYQRDSAALQARRRIGDVDVDVRDRADGRPEIVVTITERPAAIVLGLAGVESLTVHATGSAIAVYAP
jgi:hypothetical protein